METIQNDKDRELWKLAKRRVSFKKHLVVYILVNIFFWGLWYLGDDKDNEGFPWPVWSTLGWGIGLGFEFAGAYMYPNTNAIENEYEKLKNKS